MPENDVSDLKDVFDAINRLCETMKESDYSEEPRLADCSDGLVDPREVIVRKVEIFHAETWSESGTNSVDTDSWSTVETERITEQWTTNTARIDNEAENIDSWTNTVNSGQSDIGTAENYTYAVQENEPNRESWTSPVSTSQFENGDQWKDSQASLTGSEVSGLREEKWSDTLTSPPGVVDELETMTSDTAPPCEQMSEMYYTASSEISLVSDTDAQDKGNGEESDKDGKECVIAGHVAAMRERFESMTRANTPCPDFLRSSSPSIDVFRNVTPSPDRLG